MTYPLRYPPVEHPARTIDDLQPLREEMQGLAGQPVLCADRHYGDEMCLEIGEPRPYESTHLSDEMQGSWQVTTQASRWRLVDETDLSLVDSDEPDSIEVVSRLLNNSSIAHVDLSPELGLTLVFSNSWRLLIAGSSGDLGVSGDLHNWVIFTDSNRILMAGPGEKWFSDSAD